MDIGFVPVARHSVPLIIKANHLDNRPLDSTQGDTPLHTVVRKQNVDMVSNLINGGAEVNIKNENGYTPLHIATEKGNAEIVEKLSVYGADMNVQDYCGWTPLLIALYFGNVDIVYKLVASGADVKLKAQDGLTALHIAALMPSSRFDNQLVKMLLENGAEVNAKFSDGSTPLDFALNQYRIVPSILELRNWGAVFTKSYYNMDNIFNANVDVCKSLGLELLSEHGGSLTSSSDIDPVYHKELLDELEKMKAKTFNQFSLYDVFRMWNHPLLLSTDDMEEFINSPLLDLDLPWFAQILRSLFVKNKRKLNLLNLIQQGVEVYLPEEIVQMILSYK